MSYPLHPIISPWSSQINKNEKEKTTCPVNLLDFSGSIMFPWHHFLPVSKLPMYSISPSVWHLNRSKNTIWELYKICKIRRCCPFSIVKQRGSTKHCEECWKGYQIEFKYLRKKIIVQGLNKNCYWVLNIKDEPLMSYPNSLFTRAKGEKRRCCVDSSISNGVFIF